MVCADCQTEKHFYSTRPPFLRVQTFLWRYLGGGGGCYLQKCWHQKPAVCVCLGRWISAKPVINIQTWAQHRWFRLKRTQNFTRFFWNNCKENLPFSEATSKVILCRGQNCCATNSGSSKVELKFFPWLILFKYWTGWPVLSSFLWHYYVYA